MKLNISYCISYLPLNYSFYQNDLKNHIETLESKKIPF